MTTTLQECAPQRVQLRIIGPMTIIGPDGEASGRALGAPKLRLLLELLLLDRGHPLPKDQLVDALWPGGRNLPTDPSRTLEHYVCVLRAALTSDKALGRAVVATRASAYLLDPHHCDIDADRFDALLREAASAPVAERRRLLEAATSLGEADLFADSPVPHTAHAQRASHREAVSWAHQVLAADALSERDLHRAVWHAESALRFTRCAEFPHHLLMVAHVGLGERDLARLQHHRCVTFLARDLGLEPSAFTEDLRRAIDLGAGLDELAGLLVSVAAA